MCTFVHIGNLGKKCTMMHTHKWCRIVHHNGGHASGDPDGS